MSDDTTPRQKLKYKKIRLEKYTMANYAVIKQTSQLT